MTDWMSALAGSKIWQGIGLLFTVGVPLLAFVSFLLRFYLNTWRNPVARRKLKRRFTEATARLRGIFNVSQRERYKTMRVRQLKKELRQLVLFRREHEMDSMRKIFSSLALAASSFLLLCLFGTSASVLVVLWGIVILEREILHQPMTQFHKTVGLVWLGHLVQLVFVALFATIVWSTTKVQTEADMLSPIFRTRRLTKIKKQLKGYGVDAEQLIREMKQGKGRRPPKPNGDLGMDAEP